MRGALFNILGDIEELSLLDAFAGSGALAFEAVSRGASQVTVLENEPNAQQAIARNVETLHLQKTVHLSKASAGGWSVHNMERRFDILLLDPPYDDVRLTLLQKLINRHLPVSGLAVLSYPGKEKPPDFAGTKPLEIKRYGDGQLIFYRKIP